MSLIGYARCSKIEQNIEIQTTALDAAGCIRTFIDHGVSGAKAERPQLTALLDYVRDGDTVVVWRLDRIARDTKNMLDLLELLERRGVKFRSLTDGIETTGPFGKAMVTIVAALSALERDVLISRTEAGLAAARARGRVGGRKPSLNAGQIRQAQALYDAQHTVSSIATTLGVSRQTIYRYLDRAKTTA